MALAQVPDHQQASSKEPVLENEPSFISDTEPQTSLNFTPTMLSMTRLPQR